MNTDVTDDLFVTNKDLFYKITYPLHLFTIRCESFSDQNVEYELVVVSVLLE